jgi:hypothetical protein
MAEETTERTEIGERIAVEASRAFAAYWLAEMARIEEQIDAHGARWSILKSALQRIARGDH